MAAFLGVLGEESHRLPRGHIAGGKRGSFGAALPLGNVLIPDRGGLLAGAANKGKKSNGVPGSICGVNGINQISWIKLCNGVPGLLCGVNGVKKEKVSARIITK